jgi:DNA-directed RNA polymerase subunit H (RpoH/RPB5)
MLTISEMMYDRGYPELSQNIQNISNTTLESEYCQKQVFNFNVEDEKDNKLKVLFALQPKLKIADLKKCFEDKVPLTILILKEKVSTSNMKTIEEIKRNNHIDIQVFHLKELRFNISKSKLVPKHELLDWRHEREIERVLQTYQVRSRFHFPNITRADPMARYLNCKTGNLVKITRSSPTAGEYVHYRCCI